MNAEALLTEFRARGIRVEPRPDGRLRLTPKDRLTPELIEQARRLKPEILSRLQIDQALAIIGRLRAFILPAGRMPAARAIVALLQPLRPELDAGETLACLQAVENELIAMGGRPDPEIAEAVQMVESVFPGSKLIEIKNNKLQ
jgi:hypothetical protein